ncbi:MAG: hypothetical protein NVSMB25_20460 [Thermoleophilaceae bacterium]
MPEPAPRPLPDERPLPVLAPAQARVIERPQQMPLSAPAMAAAGGFLAGLTTFILARMVRSGTRWLPLRRRRALDIAGSRSFLVDVHVLKR